MKQLTLSDYQSLAEFRYRVRCYLHFSENAARKSGLEPRQYQLMLALKGLPAGSRPRIGEVAERLKLQHHSTVELVNRLAAHDYVKRHRGRRDRREVLLSLTPKGERVLGQLVSYHRAELSQAGPALLNALRRVMRGANTGRPSRNEKRTRK